MNKNETYGNAIVGLNILAVSSFVAYLFFL